jgi:Fe-S oxidoreductase
MWMEETRGTKVNDERARELLDTGATRIATACPFCYIMIDDGVKGHGFEEEQVKVGDLAMHLLDAIERGERETGTAGAVATARVGPVGPVSEPAGS